MQNEIIQPKTIDLTNNSEKQMKFTIFFTTLFFSILILGSSIVHGKKFHKDGHEIEILFKQKGDKLNVWGKITGGKSTCEQMNLRIYFDNSISGQNASVSTKINKFRPNGRNNFKAVTKIYKHSSKEFHQKSSRYKWFIDNYYLKCLN